GGLRRGPDAGARRAQGAGRPAVERGAARADRRRDPGAAGSAGRAAPGAAARARLRAGSARQERGRDVADDIVGARNQVERKWAADTPDRRTPEVAEGVVPTAQRTGSGRLIRPTVGRRRSPKASRRHI